MARLKPVEIGRTWKQSAGASYLGVFFVAVVALGGLGGNWLDVRFHQSFIFAALGVFLGMAAGIREMLKVLKESAVSGPADEGR
ncbi:MAG: AtpZ/AtpI family protein [Armatimonadota bacterium]|nr:AtpZ/AtpI family protein [Armatimonadota bacterium]